MIAYATYPYLYTVTPGPATSLGPAHPHPRPRPHPTTTLRSPHRHTRTHHHHPLSLPILVLSNVLTHSNPLAHISVYLPYSSTTSNTIHNPLIRNSQSLAFVAPRSLSSRLSLIIRHTCHDFIRLFVLWFSILRVLAAFCLFSFFLYVYRLDVRRSMREVKDRLPVLRPQASGERALFHAGRSSQIESNIPFAATYIDVLQERSVFATPPPRSLR